MRTRAPALVVVVFAMAVAALAVFAAKSDDGRLVKLPVASLGGAAADESGAGVASTRSALLYGGPVEYRVEGTLPDLPGTAPAYRLGSTTTAGAVADLARALGLAGEAQADDNGWVVRSGDRELRVENLPGLPWYLGSACPEATVSSEGGQTVVSCGKAVTGVATPVDGGSAGSAGAAEGCPPGAECLVADPGTVVAPTCPADAADCRTGDVMAPPVCTDDANGGCPAPYPLPTPVPACKGGTVECLPAPAPGCTPGARCIEPAPAPAPVPPGTEPAPAPGCPPDATCDEPAPEKPHRPVDLPSEEDARRLAREGFARLGVGTEGLVVEDGWVTWEARVEARVDGLPVIGMGTSLSIGAKGEIVSANGFLAVPDRIGDYPLVGTDAGLRRLSTGFGFGFGGPGPRPLVATDDGASLEGAPEPARPECADPTASCVPPPEPAPTVQIVTGAHLALLHTGEVLVPAYVFELADDDGALPVPAVTDEWLDQQASTLKE